MQHGNFNDFLSEGFCMVLKGGIFCINIQLICNILQNMQKLTFLLYI